MGSRLTHLLVGQELKPGEVLLGRSAGVLHASSLLHPVQGEDVRHAAGNVSRASALSV